jgi:D-amino-acid dehydrogenase
MMEKHVMIIGAGAVGLGTAWYCARRGFRVTVIERNGAARDGCSYGNAGLVVPSHFVPLASPGMVALGLKWMRNPESPFYIKPRLDWDLISWGYRFWRASTPEHVRQCAPFLRDFNLAGRACFEELAALPGGDFDFATKGLLALCKTPAALDHEAQMALRSRELGLPAEVLDARQTAAREPGMRMEIAGSVFFPLDCHLSPHRFMPVIQRHVEGAGVQFHWDTEVSGFVRQGKRLVAVKTSRGEFQADEFVIAAGSWSTVMARELGLRLPMQAGKGYSLTLPKPRQLPQIPAILTEARVAVTPMGGSLRFGGTMEIAGLNEDLNSARVQGIIKAAPKYYPDIGPADFEGIQPWCGLRPCSPDGLPYVGRTGRFDNLLVATGHAMMGLSLGPVTGKLLAEMLAGEKPSLDLTLLNPDRYA